MKKYIVLFVMTILVSSTVFSATITSESFNPTSDGFVRQADNTYQGTGTNMELRSYSGLSREIYMNFDLSSITITPQAATLKLYLSSSNPTPCTAFIASAYVQTGNVNTSTLTYTGRPVTGQTRGVDIQASQDSIGKWLQFDLSDYFKSQDLTTNKLFTIRIVIAAPIATSPLLYFGSIESSKKPILVLGDAQAAGVYEVPYTAFNSFTAINSYSLGSPQYAFDGSGLLPAMCHDTVANNKAWRNTGGTFPTNIIVKMNNAINIKKFHIWNLNFVYGGIDYTNRSVKNMDIYISTSTDDLSAVTDFTDSRWTKVSGTGVELTQANKSITIAYGDEVPVTGADNARWFALNINSNWGATSGYTGLSEVKVYKQVYPDVATASTVEKLSSTTVSSNNGVVSINNFAPNALIKIYNANGQILRDEICKATSFEIQLAAGFYIVNVNGESFKVLIAK